MDSLNQLLHNKLLKNQIKNYLYQTHDLIAYIFTKAKSIIHNHYQLTEPRTSFKVLWLKFRLKKKKKEGRTKLLKLNYFLFLGPFYYLVPNPRPLTTLQ